MLEEIFNNQEKDEHLNISLAEKIVAENNEEGIKELVSGLQEKKIANDCIKILYELGERKPELIASEVQVFLDLLASKNNRLVWGSMTALSTIAHLKGAEIFAQLTKVEEAYEKGSVITVDNAISVFSKVASTSPAFSKVIFPKLCAHLKTCRVKEIPQHAKRISVAVNEENKALFLESLKIREKELSKSQEKRLEAVLKNI